MTAVQKRKRALAVENLYYLYKKYYPILEDELKAAQAKQNKVN